MSNIINSDRIAPALPEDDYFTPEARVLCARVKHKSELTDKRLSCSRWPRHRRH
jgi:hypothetical protein